MTAEEIEAIAHKIYELLRDDVFRLPPEAAKYLEPFKRYVPMPVSIGYGPDYCVLYASVTDIGGLLIELRTANGTRLWRLALLP